MLIDVRECRTSPIEMHPFSDDAVINVHTAEVRNDNNRAANWRMETTNHKPD